MINRGTKDLYRQLDEAQRMIKSSKSMDEKVALANYIGNIYTALICMGDGNVSFDKNSCFGRRNNYNKFLKKLDIYTDRMTTNYFNCQTFHKEFLRELIPDVEDIMRTFCILNFDYDDRFSYEEFLEIFSAFMSSLGLQEMFDRYYKNGNIYSSIIGSDEDNLGFTIYNPISHSGDIFVKGLEPTISGMSILAHEFGHSYDNEHFNGSIASYNQYFYISFFGEVMSRLFERMLFRFLLQNGINSNAVMDKLIDFEVINFDYLLKAYVLSLLDENVIRSGEMDSEKIYNKVKSYFLDDSDIKSFIDRMDEVDLAEVYNYVYGDFISMFLCEEVGKSGFSSDLIRYFFQERDKMFSEDFLKECGFNTGKYSELYKKEAQLIKK